MGSGVEGFSVNKLAKECGISVATLYIYYRDKDNLIRKIVAEEARRMSDAMLESFDPELSFADGLRQQWKNRAHYYAHQPHGRPAAGTDSLVELPGAGPRGIR